MNCLIDHIGWLGCGSSTPPSGIYINSLPGISFKSMQSIADEEQRTIEGVWSDVQIRASRRFSLAVINALEKRYSIKTISQVINIRKLCNASVTTALGGKVFGFTVETLNSAGYSYSSLMAPYVQTLTIYAPAASTHTVAIYDLITGDRLWSSDVTFTIGWNQVNVFQTFYQSPNIGVGVYDNDSTYGDAVNHEIGSDIRYQWDNCSAYVRGWSVTPDSATLITPSSVSYGTDTYGITGVIGLRCLWDSLVCNTIDEWTTAWWYCLGSELMQETMYSPRLNKYTTIMDAEKLKGVYDADMESAITATVNGIRIEDYDCCIRCNDNYRLVESV